jgi:hypothetical protein
LLNHIGFVIAVSMAVLAMVFWVKVGVVKTNADVVEGSATQNA